MLFDKIKKINRKNSNDKLKEKFEMIESRAENMAVRISSQESSQDASSLSHDNFEGLIEEEIMWWESDFEGHEKSTNENFANFKNTIIYLKKSPLYSIICKNESLRIDTVSNDDEEYVLVTWDSDYLNLVERRRVLESIKDFKKDVADDTQEVSLVHNHRRLSISNNIGLKIVVSRSDGVNKNKQDGGVNGEINI